MGKKQTADGRWIIGGGENRTDYKGFLHWRECYICLTESGATEESVDYLNALKDYALAHYALGEPIMPPSMTVWVVANGKATAVQADDVKVEDGDYTICGITYSDGAWDYSNAGQGQGGGGSSLPPVTAEDNGDVLTVMDGEWGKAAPSGISGTDEWKGRFQNIAFIYYEPASDIHSDIQLILPQATIWGSAEGHQDGETGDFTVEFGDWMTEDFEPIPDELAPYAAAVLPAIRHDFLVAHKIKGSDGLTWYLPALTITTAYYSE